VKPKVRRYSKQPPNKPFDGVSCTRYDADRHRNKVVFTIIEANLSIKFCSTHAPKKTQVDFYVADFKQYTALYVINNINDFCSSVFCKIKV